MSDNPPQSRLLANLPFDVLLKIFSECDVDDILNLSAVSTSLKRILLFLTVPQTCKRLKEASGEHQTWLNQATRLQIPIPTDIAPSTAELKNWATSWVRSDELWVKPRDDGDRRFLNLHWFNTRQDDPDKEDPTRFVMANLIPGGKFVVVLYIDGQIDLKEIKIESDEKWDLQDVARYKQDDPEKFYIMFWSQLLTETNIGPLVAFTDQERERWGQCFSGPSTRR